MTQEREDLVKLMFRVHTDTLDHEESELMAKYLTPDQVIQIEVNAMKNRQAVERREVERDLGLPIPAHVSPQHIQELQRFKTNFGKNLEDLFFVIKNIYSLYKNKRPEGTLNLTLV